jgi:putative SOS response-associated peptidase YedK
VCGRYRLSRRKQLVEEYFDTASGEEDWIPRYNVAPTQTVPVIRQRPKEPVRELSLMRWGLIPSWARDASGAARMINARSETARTKPAFCDAMMSRRCLIPADGFYEWMRMEKTKQPYCFEINNGELFALAGLWHGIFPFPRQSVPALLCNTRLLKVMNHNTVLNGPKKVNAIFRNHT